MHFYSKPAYWAQLVLGQLFYAVLILRKIPWIHAFNLDLAGSDEGLVPVRFAVQAAQVM